MSSPSLPALVTGALTITLAGTSLPNLLDGIYDALNTTTTYDDGTSIPTNTKWVPTKYQNAGTTEAVYAVPAAGSPVAGKVVLIFAGAAAGTHSSVVMASPDTYTNGILFFGAYVATAGGTVSASNFSSWDGASPFTAGGRFTGYCRVYTATAATKVGLFSTDDWIGVQVEVSGAIVSWCWGGFGVRGLTDGAVDAESGLGGRVFDFGTNGSGAALAYNWLSVPTSGSTGGCLGHNTAANYQHAWYLTPGSSTIRPLSYRRANEGNSPDPFPITSAASCVGLSGAVEPEPIALRDVGSGGNVGRKIGRHRAFYVGPTSQNKSILSAGGTKKWISWAQSSLGAADAYLLPIA